MTHGWLLIKRSDEERAVLMHTYHSGYLIPDTVKTAPEFLCKLRWGFIVEKRFDYPTFQALKEGVSNLAFDDGLFYQPSVAGLLCARRPWNLEVVPEAFMEDSSSRMGGQPNTLIMNEKTNIWELISEEGNSLFTLDPTARMLSWLWGEISGAAGHSGKEPDNRSPRNRSSGTKVN